ncbi:MAG: hypothetical protein CMF96_10265 [Candidatus Marinimicrobia bacterium]|nr:hypothetical protein [Candidatus Neomarinimicrobiota bacterium]|tara:strand:- start:4919 stop:6118 length:1200 start_codon:yes stop_codon:yes gene_type:complete
MNINDFLKSLKPRKIKLGHERTINLMRECGNPQKGLNAIQIAGTNGKGSVCAILERIYRTAGYKTGLFTSPHLNRVNERIRINGNAIDNLEIYNFLSNYGRSVIKSDASFFETITAIAFWLFKKQEVDIAIMETGLGGRLDSVTVCEPIATGITKIAMDHVEILGDSIEKIAYEKAGIMKKQIPCFTIKQNQKVLAVLKNHAIENKCSLKVVDPKENKKTSLHGKHQNQNLGLAMSIIESLNQYIVSDKHISSAMRSLKWYGRYQVLSNSPKIIFDVGHNSNGISAFLNTFSSEKIAGKKYLLIALQSRKNISDTSIQLLNLFDKVLCTEIRVKNYMPAFELRNSLLNHKKTEIVSCITNKYLEGFIQKLEPEDALCIVGTHYFGELISNVFKISFDNL